MNDPESKPGGEAYERLVRHERSLWMTMVAVVAMSAVTIAILTAAAALAGAFQGHSRGFLLAGGSFVILSGFIAYVGLQRETLEDNRRRILDELESRSEELSRANQALQDALSSQETFLNCVSHELKTPLTCMMGYADLLATGRLQPEAALGHAKGIVEEGRSLGEIIDRILDITRIQGGTLRLDRTSGDLLEVVRKALERVQSDADRAGVSVHAEFPAEPFRSPIDVSRIEEGLVGMFQRAIKRSASGDKVYVHLRALGEEWVEVSVEDRGPRMDAAERQALWQPFAEVDIAPQGRVGDLGLELPLFRRVAMAHGGDVVVQEVGIRGARFRVLLPRDLAVSPSVASDPSGDHPLLRA